MQNMKLRKLKTEFEQAYSKIKVNDAKFVNTEAFQLPHVIMLFKYI
jgi:hypothetical protein